MFKKKLHGFPHDPLLRNMILKHAYDCNPQEFLKTCSQDLLEDKSHKPNDSHMKEGQYVVHMNNLSLVQVMALVDIYNAKYPTLKMSAKRLGFLNDLNRVILSETCVLEFNAEVFQKKVLPLMRDIPDELTNEKEVVSVSQYRV
ncbi:MAG TPA: hypothetical protein VHM20_08390 [Gammaproteobacteria bacterium]|jgi:hypothetical protein|nr:hypothetical protein [Gammaproteobacteria bacterium]